MTDLARLQDELNKAATVRDATDGYCLTETADAARDPVMVAVKSS